MSVRLLKPRRFFIVTLLHVPLLTGCELPVEVKEGLTKIEAISAAQADGANAGQAVCNPFGSSGGVSGRNQGLQGELFHLSASQPKFTRLDPYFLEGTRAPAQLFFDQVNVPTRPFDAGFLTLDGEVLKTPEGNTLYEWFALRLESQLRLVQGDRAGKKQFALLTDDGSRLRMKLNGQWETVVENDENHPTKLVVSSFPIDMNSSSSIPIELQYFQGPRYHIALMILWRDWPEGENAWKDPLNGQLGNSLYFDSSKSPPEPQQAYKDLLSRGWNPISSQNFYLESGGAQENPCPENPKPENPNPEVPTDPVDPSEPTNPQDPTNPTDPIDPKEEQALSISGFDGTTTNTTANLIWQTPGAPSTTKIYWGTVPDNLNANWESQVNTMIHQVTVSGLQPATVYYFQAESTNASGMSVRSQVLIKATK